MRCSGRRLGGLVTKWVLLTMVVMLSVPVRAELPTQVVLATTDWAPYTSGPSVEQPGIVSEYLTYILTKHKVRLVIKSYPWSRAIYLASNTKKVDGLLTAVYEEAPSLLFTDTPIMNYKVNFYTLATESWTYTGFNSLNSVPAPLGLIQDYGYGEQMEAYLKDRNHQANLMILTGASATERLWKMLAKGRVRTILSDPSAQPQSAKGVASSRPQYRMAGTLIDSPFYTALNPNRAWSQQLIQLLDKELADKDNIAVLQTLIQKYQLH